MSEGMALLWDLNFEVKRVNLTELILYQTVHFPRQLVCTKLKYVI